MDIVDLIAIGILNTGSIKPIQASQEIEVASCTLEELLGSNSKPIPGTSIQGQLAIPEYQRPYVWKEKQINQLLNDLIEYEEKSQETKPLYYLGSIILHQDGEQLKIIDGQQRITTFLLIQKLIHAEIKSGIEYSTAISIENIKYNLGYLQSVMAKDIFEYRDKSVLESIDLSQINVTLIVTKTEDLAYTFFETQNTGGVRLSGSDILKAHHLRAIPTKKIVEYQARKWESTESDNVEYVVQLLTKIRFWDNRKWRLFPFYKDKERIKSALIEEYTVNTKSNYEDISYHYSAVKNENGRLFQMHESTYKQLKQPLANGNNTLDFVNEYIQLHEVLFGKQPDYRIEDSFYEFRNQVLHGKDGTLFLKELFEIATISYVSRFGFHRLFEASLWLYRMIYSLRVSTGRNVREDSVFKFVYDSQMIDNILEVYTPDELFNFLKKFRFEFKPDYLEPESYKGKHIATLGRYFDKVGDTQFYKDNPKEFDKDVLESITLKIKNGKKI